jgi:hypothetical protein
VPDSALFEQPAGSLVASIRVAAGVAEHVGRHDHAIGVLLLEPEEQIELVGRELTAGAAEPAPFLGTLAPTRVPARDAWEFTGEPGAVQEHQRVVHLS